MNLRFSIWIESIANATISIWRRYAVIVGCLGILSSTGCGTESGAESLSPTPSIFSESNGDDPTHIDASTTREQVNRAPHDLDFTAQNTIEPIVAGQIGRRQRQWEQMPQENVPDRGGIPEWEFDRRFRSDAFRFVRVKFDSIERRGPNGLWYTDYPDSDLNFSFRLKQLTTLDVDPDPLWLEITDPRLLEYPFLYMIEPGFIILSDEEVAALRTYFDRGGFMMVDDFWGEYEWRNFHREMSRVFPNQQPLDLPFEHPIFHLVYDLPEKPQVPSIHNWERYGTTYEREDAREVHYRGYFDDNGRMVMIICHNTDLGDGWEREGQSREYFETFSERLAYPIGINIVVYAMTH